MPAGDVRPNRFTFFASIAGISFAFLVPVACRHGGGLGPIDAGIKDGSSGGSATGGVGEASTGGVVGTGGVIGSGGVIGGGGAAVDSGAGGSVNDAGASDQAITDASTTDGEPSDGAMMDASGMDVAFPCGPCSPHWICGGLPDGSETDIDLVPEDDGCYLSGLSGHKLLQPDGTITEDGIDIARVQRFGPQIGAYYPDGGQWFYCGGALPCPGM